ncbi:MAG: UbiA family prenyltransferase [Planctomycetes bacterium]|nr:UbiA family prenyltransferase [Planctomycetota bacterium]
MAWLRIFRIALLPTIAWDFSVGILLAGIQLEQWPFAAFVALALIYHGSMVLNDVADQKIDASAKRNRPLVTNEINRWSALVIGLAMYSSALLICFLFHPLLVEMCVYLLAVVLAYNFSGNKLRTFIGPALLATARAFSLMFGVSALLGPAAALTEVAYVNIMSYALYYLFISRLAQHEECGLSAARGLSFLAMAFISPTLLLAQQDFSLLLLASIMAFILFSFRSPWQLRKVFWDQAIVQSQIRSSLCMAPIVLGLCLLASPYSNNHVLAIFSVMVVVITAKLAKSFAPE